MERETSNGPAFQNLTLSPQDNHRLLQLVLDFLNLVRLNQGTVSELLSNCLSITTN